MGVAITITVGAKTIVLSDAESVAFETLADSDGGRVSATFGGDCLVDSLEIELAEKNLARAIAAELLKITGPA